MFLLNDRSRFAPSHRGQSGKIDREEGKQHAHRQLHRLNGITHGHFRKSRPSRRPAPIVLFNTDVEQDRDAAGDGYRAEYGAGLCVGANLHRFRFTRATGV